MTQEIIDRSAGEMARAVAQGEVSAREVVEASLGRVEAFNPAVNAVCTLNERALVEAEACDRRLRGGAPARALEGVPVVIKDVVATKGLRTTFGSLLCEHHVPTEDSLCVARLKAAGAIVVGKTNTPEFAHDPVTRNKLFGTTRNPWNLHYTAGGSSGGTAAAVAAGDGSRRNRHRPRRIDPLPCDGVRAVRHPAFARPGRRLSGPGRTGRRPRAWMGHLDLPRARSHHRDRSRLRPDAAGDRRAGRSGSELVARAGP